MPTLWLLAPYKEKSVGPQTIRYCSVADFTKDIISVGGDWRSAELGGNNAIVRIRAPGNTIDDLIKNSDVEIKKIEKPEDYWMPTRISVISGKVFQTKTIEKLTKNLLDDQGWGSLKALAENLATESDQKGHIKIARGDWAITVQLLAILGKAGYTLDKISTGTFPTTGILDNFDRANNATSMGGNWGMSKSYLGNTDWGITGNKCYNPDLNQYTCQYYNANTYGPDLEAYVTHNPLPASVADQFCIHGRVTNPGNLFEGYSVAHNLSGSPQAWDLYYYDNGNATHLYGPINQTVGNDDKIGFEIIGDVLTGYLNNGTGWAVILSDSDSTYTTGGYIGLYNTGSNIAWRLDDFGGGTVAAAEASFDQEDFRWRKDDGNEASATWDAAQGNNITQPAGTTRRIRFIINNTGGAGNITPLLEGKEANSANWMTIN